MIEKNDPRPYKDGGLAKVRFVTDGVVGRLIVNGVDLYMCCEEVTSHQGDGECATIDLRIIPDDVEISGDFRVLGTRSIGIWGKSQPAAGTDSDADT